MFSSLMQSLFGTSGKTHHSMGGLRRRTGNARATEADRQCPRHGGGLAMPAPRRRTGRRWRVLRRITALPSLIRREFHSD